MKTVLTLLVLAASLPSMAQVCEPDPAIPDTLFGVFPLPYDETESPEGGINDSACFNYPFEFVFTTNVGDSFPFGSTRLPLDSLRLGKTGAVSGLPKGISYACNPPSCTFIKGTRGCVILKGIVKESSEIGDHQLKLSGTLYANGSSSGLNLTFPSPLIAPGTYTLTVLPKDDSKCEKLDTDRDLENQLAVYPNPSLTGTVRVNLPGSALCSIKVYSATGQLVNRSFGQGGTTETINLTGTGMYQVVIETDQTVLRKSLVVE